MNAAQHINGTGVMPRMQSDREDRAMNGFRDIGRGWAQRLTGAGEFKKRIDEVGHQIHAGPNFLIQLLALYRGEVAVAKKFGVGDDGGERMAQIVGDRAGHAPNRRELFGFQQIALALEQAGAHAIEGPGQLGHFVAPARIEWMVEVSTFQSADAGYEASQRTGEGVRDKEYQSAAN